MNTEKSVNAMEFREAEGKMELLLVSNLLESSFEPMKDREAAARFITIAEDIEKLWVLDIDGTLAGTVSVNPVKNKEGVWFINNLSIAPYWRKGGLAKFMLAKCFEYLKQQNAVSVIVLLHPDLVAAESLFLEQLEFTPVKKDDQVGVYLATLKF